MKGKMIIVSIVTIIVLCLIGVGVFCVIWASPLKYSLMRFGPKSQNRIIEKEIPIEEVEEINIFQSAGDVLIKESKDNSIKVIVYGDNAEDFSFENTENKISISSNIHNKEEIFDFNVKNDDVLIYMPKSYSEDIKIKIKYGKCIIENLENASVEISCEAGNADVGSTKNIIAHCDCGNVNIDNVNNYCDIKVKFGNVRIKELALNKESAIKIDFGNIDIYESNDVDIYPEVKIGSINIEKKEVEDDKLKEEKKEEQNATEVKPTEKPAPKIEEQPVEQTEENQEEDELDEENQEIETDEQVEKSQVEKTEDVHKEEQHQNEQKKEDSKETEVKENEKESKPKLFLNCKYGNINVK